MDNVYAMRLSRAAINAEAGGDMMDPGWSLIKALHVERFDVIPREKLNAMDRRKTLNEMCGLTDVKPE